MAWYIDHRVFRSLKKLTSCAGTSESSATKILQEGPNPCLSGANTGRSSFGPGFYTSAFPLLALQEEYSPPNARNEQILIKFLVIAHKPKVNRGALLKSVPPDYVCFVDRTYPRPQVYVHQDRFMVLPVAIFRVQKKSFQVINQS